MNGKILTSLLVIGLTIVLIGGATFAYFYDTETSAGNTFTASTLDLTVDDENDPLPVKFNISTLRPCRSGTITYVLRNVGTVDGYVDLENVTVVNTGGLHPEPELAVDPQNNGSLGDSMVINVTISGNEIYNSSLNGFAGNHNRNVPLAAGATTNVTINWTIPKTVGNKIQGDIAHVNITFVLSQINDVIQPLILKNGGFEMSNFTYWNVSDIRLAKVVETYTSDEDTIFSPIEGRKFAVLTAGDENVYTVVNRTVFLEAGQGLAGWAAFDAKDELPYDDDSAVVIISGNPLVTPWSKNISDVGNYGESDWESWSWTATANGYYTLELKIANRGDNYFESAALFDAHVITQ